MRKTAEGRMRWNLKKILRDLSEITESLEIKSKAMNEVKKSTESERKSTKSDLFLGPAAFTKITEYNLSPNTICLLTIEQTNSFISQANTVLIDTECVQPVSYTHLDVYKRQVDNCERVPTRHTTPKTSHTGLYYRKKCYIIRYLA